MISRKLGPPFCYTLSAAIVLLALGCKSSSGAKNSPPVSGRPEVKLGAGPTAEQVHSVVTDFFRGRGYVEAESRHRYEFVFDKPTTSNRSGKALRVRLRLIKQLDGSWDLIGTPLGVEAWRSDLESEVMLPQGASQIQAFLVEIKNRVEAGR